MSVTITSQKGDMVDAICQTHYGNTSATEAVLEANPRLAKQGPILPEGIVIVLPEINVSTSQTLINLWN